MSPSFIERNMFHPTSSASVTLEELGRPGEEVFLQTHDGVRIHAYWLPSPGASRAILFLHGNAGNASDRLPNAALLAGLGAHVLLLEYRGYGRSEGTATEHGVYQDAQAALLHLVEARGIPENRIVVFGRSLGGAVAVDAVAKRPVAGVILESTFTSLAGMVRALLHLPLGWLAGRHFDSAAKIQNVRSPILMLHGDRDTVVPIAVGRELFELAPEPKMFEVIRGAGHNDTVEFGGRAYLERVERFLDEVAP